MSTTLAPSVSHRDPKGRKFITIVEQAYDKAALSEDEAQRVNETAGLATLLADFFARARLRQDFADEEVASTWGYPPEYEGPLSIRRQVNKLAELYRLQPGETFRFIDRVLPTLTLPDGAEGWFAIPSDNAMAAHHFPSVTNPHERYCRAVLLMLEKLKESRRFYNYREGEITVDRLRQHARTAVMLERIDETQKGDILVIPSQFGLRHRGKSVRRDRVVFGKNEFGHGALSVGSMLLTHPTRLVRWEQLHIDCAGDEFAPEADGVFSNAPIFNFNVGEVRFNACPVDGADGQFGASSGFLPQ